MPTTAYKRMVTAQRQRELALARDSRNIVRESLIDGRDRNRLAQLANRLVFLLCLVRELGDLSLKRRVVLDIPAQLFELRRKSRLGQRSGTLVNTSSRLASREGVGEDLALAHRRTIPQLRGTGKAPVARCSVRTLESYSQLHAQTHLDSRRLSEEAVFIVRLWLGLLQRLEEVSVASGVRAGSSQRAERAEWSGCAPDGSDAARRTEKRDTAE